MAVFNNGSGSLGSTTYENALWEAMSRAAILDAALTTPTGNITENIGINAANVVLNATIPVDVSTVGGKLTLSAVDFLSAAFNPGTGGNLAATTLTWPAAILELATKIQEMEFDQQLAVVNITYNADAGTATVTGTLNVDRTISAAGAQSYTARAYLA